MPLVQFFIDNWADITKEEAINEISIYLEACPKITRYLIATEFSKEEQGAKGIRVHHQGVIEYTYKKKQNLDDYLKVFCNSKGLKGKTKDWGCTNGTRKTLEENLIYVLKDQIQLEHIRYKGFESEYLKGLFDKWIPKEEYKKQQKEKRGKEYKTYNWLLLERYESERTLSFCPTMSGKEKDRMRKDIIEFFIKAYTKDKMSIPMFKIEEGIAAVFIHYKLIEIKEVSNKIMSNIQKKYLIIE